MSSAFLDEIEDTVSAEQGFSAADRLRSETTAVRLHVRWPGVRKTLDEVQKRRAADAFEADLKSLSAAKKLLDTSHPKFKAVSAIRSQAVAYWRGCTLPYIEAGVRLIRREGVTAFDVQMRTAQAELAEAVMLLDDCYGELVQQARERLGDLFDARDYPASLEGMFEISWDYPSCAPPDYLRRVSPELYEAESHNDYPSAEPGDSSARRAATPAQIQTIQGIAGRLGIGLAGPLQQFGVSSPAELSLPQASQLIDQLKQSRTPASA